MSARVYKVCQTLSGQHSFDGIINWLRCLDADLVLTTPKNTFTTFDLGAQTLSSSFF